MFRRILSAAILVLLAAVLLLALWPQLLGLERQAIVAQVVSLRGIAVLVAAGVVILFALFSLLNPETRRFSGGVAVVLLAFCAVTVAVLASRGFGSTGLAPDEPGDVTVLSWNTLGDEPGAE